MNKQTKTAQLEARQAEAIKTATEAEKAARKAYLGHLLTISFGSFEATFPTFGARKARKAYERAQENRLAVVRQYAALLQAVCNDFTETNCMRTN